MKFHDLALLIARKEGKKKSIDITQIREVLSILRDWMSRCSEDKLFDALQLLVKSKPRARKEKK